MPITSEDRAREARLRRLAARFDLKLMRSRQRCPEALDYGRYAVVDPFRNTIVFGATERFNASLDEVEEWLSEAAPEG